MTRSWRRPDRALLWRAVWLFAAFVPSCSRSPLPPLPEIPTGRFNEAIARQIRDARQAAVAEPQSAERAGAFGMTLHAYQEFDAAGACYRRAARLDPAASKWAYLSGVTEMALGRDREAIERLEECRRLSPNDAAVHVKLADLYQRTGRLPEAKESAGRALRLAPDHPEGHFRLGRILLDEAAVEASTEHLRKAAALVPRSADAHFALAAAYRRSGDAGRAEWHAARSVSLRKSAEPWRDPLLDEVARQRIGSPQALVDAGLRSEASGDLAAAAGYYRQAIEADGQFVQAHINLVSVLGQTGDIERARLHYRSALAIDPNYEELHYNYGVLLLRTGDGRAAEAPLREAVRLNPLSAPALHNLGCALELQRRDREAVAQFEKAIAAEPGYRAAHLHLGKHYLAARQFDRGLTHLDAAAGADRETPHYQYSAANILFRAGRRPLAIEYAKKAEDSAIRWERTDLLPSIREGIKVLSGR